MHISTSYAAKQAPRDLLSTWNRAVAVHRSIQRTGVKETTRLELLNVMNISVLLDLKRAGLLSPVLIAIGK